MNIKQANYIVNIIQKNAEIKSKAVVDALSHDYKQSMPVVNSSLENEYSLLGKSFKLLIQKDNIDKKIARYLKDNNLTDETIKTVALRKHSNVSTVSELVSKIKKCFENKKLYFDKFVYEAFLEVSKLDNVSLDSATPQTLLDLINANRKQMGLSSVVEFSDKKILGDYLVDGDVEIDKKLDTNSLYESLKIFESKFDTKLNASEGFISLFRSLFEVLTLNYAEKFPLGVYLENNKNLNEEIVYAKKMFDGMQENMQQSVQNSFKNVVALMLTNRALALTLQDKETYILTATLTRYCLANELQNLAKNLNSHGITYALADCLNQSFYSMINTLGLTNEQMISKFNSNGIVLNSNESIILANQMEEYSSSSQYKFAGEVTRFNIKTLTKEAGYIETTKAYQSAFDGLKQKLGFVANVKIDNAVQNTKVQTISNLIGGSITLIEETKFVTDEQLGILIDAHACLSVSSSVLTEIAKEFNWEPKVVNNTTAINVEPVKTEEKQVKKEPTEDELLALINKNGVNYPKLTVRKEIPQGFKFLTPKLELPAVIQNIKKADSQKQEATEKDSNKKELKFNFENANILKLENNQTTNEYVAPNFVIKESKTEVEEQKPVENKKLEKETIKAETKLQTNEKVDLVQKEVEKPVEQVEKVAKKQDAKKVVATNEVVKENKVEPKPENKKEKNMEQTNKMNEQLEKQKKEIENLKKQLELAKQANQKNNNQSVASVDEKVSAMKEKISAVLSQAFKKSSSTLANKNLLSDETNFTNSILHFNNCSKNTQLLASSLNMLFVMGEGDTTVRNMFVAMNKAQTAKNLMRLKGNLENVLIENLAEKMANKLAMADVYNIPADIAVDKALESYSSKYIKELEFNRKNELKTLAEKYGEDSFEYEDGEKLVNNAYFGERGYFKAVNNCRLSLVAQEILIAQLAEIDYAEENEIPYTFNKEQINSIVDEIVGKVSVEEHLF